MRDKILAFAMLAALFVFSGMTPNKWCRKPLNHGDAVYDARGKYLVMDGRKLREFSNHTLLNWYKVRKDLRCVLPNSIANHYLKGRNILFRPDQDLEETSLLKMKNSGALYLWHAGKVYRLAKGFMPTAFNGKRPITISRLEMENLSFGSFMTRKLFFKTVKAQQKRRLWNGSLLRGSHSARIYLIKGGMRYRFWSQWAFKRRKLKKSNLTRIRDDVLYSIPFGGYLF